MPLLEVAHLRTHFPVRGGLLGRQRLVRAVDDVSLQVDPGETVGVVGESGCGKSTLARALIHLAPVTSGRIALDGEDVSRPSRDQLKRLRAAVQMVFQDPYGSLNPRMSARTTLDEVLRVHTKLDAQARRSRTVGLLEQVGLRPDNGQSFPHELSGGQRQRLGIARCLAASPKLILADEPVSSLDVSVQAQIVNLFIELREQLGLAYLFIAHDVAVVRHISRRILVMYLGRVVESARAEALVSGPRHPYTRALLSAVPRLGAGRSADGPGPEPLRGGVPSPIDPPPGCAFHPRCPDALPRCRAEPPELRPVKGEPERAVACHLVPSGKPEPEMHTR